MSDVTVRLELPRKDCEPHDSDLLRTRQIPRLRTVQMRLGGKPTVAAGLTFRHTGGVRLVR